MSMTLSLVLLHLSIAIISMSFWLSPPDPSPGKALQSYNHFLFPANFSVKNFVIPFPALSPQALLKSECKGSDFPHHHQTFPQLFFQYFFQACRIHIIIYGTNEPNGTNKLFHFAEEEYFCREVVGIAVKKPSAGESTVRIILVFPGFRAKERLVKHRAFPILQLGT